MKSAIYFVFVSFILFYYARGQVMIDHVNILNDFYFATNGQNWINKWNISTPICSRYGVTCINGTLTSIVLNSNALKGTIPTSFSSLTLVRLELRSNRLSGIIPTLSVSDTLLLRSNEFYCPVANYSLWTPNNNDRSFYSSVAPICKGAQVCFSDSLTGEAKCTSRTTLFLPGILNSFSTWKRPSIRQDFTCCNEGVSQVPYYVFSLSVSNSGPYEISVSSFESNDVDSYLHVFTPSFHPIKSSILPNPSLFAVNDDISQDNFLSRVTVFLNINTVYSIVVSSFNPSSVGKISLSMKGPYNFQITLQCFEETESNAIFKTTLAGRIANGTCAFGYTPADSVPITRECLSNGEWSSTISGECIAASVLVQRDFDMISQLIQNQIGPLQEIISVQNQTIFNLNESLEKMNNVNSQQNISITSLNQSVNQQRQNINNLNSTILQQGKTISSLNQIVSTQTQTLNSLNQANSQQNETITNLNQIINQIINQNQNISNQINQILSQQSPNLTQVYILISQITTRTDQLNSSIIDLNAKSKQQDLSIQAVSKSITQISQNITSINSLISQINTKNNQQDSSINQQTNRNNQQDQSIQLLNQTIITQKQALDQVSSNVLNLNSTVNQLSQTPTINTTVDSQQNNLISQLFSHVSLINQQIQNINQNQNQSQNQNVNLTLLQSISFTVGDLETIQSYRRFKQISRFSTGYSAYQIRSMACQENRIYVFAYNQIRILDKNNFSLIQVLSQSVSQVDYMNVYLTKNQDILVPDRTRHLVYQISKNNPFVLNVFMGISSNGLLSGPSSIAIDDEQNIIVAEYYSSRVSIFDSTGNNRISVLYGFTYPYKVEINPVNKRLYVLDISARNIRIFQKLSYGNYFQTEMRSLSYTPYSFNFDKYGNYFISDTYSYVRIYESDGTLLNTMFATNSTRVVEVLETEKGKFLFADYYSSQITTYSTDKY